MRPEHLSVVLKGAPVNRTDRAGAALTRVVNLMTRGEVPEAVSPFLCGARLRSDPQISQQITRWSKV